jgi:hypothetical protein
MKPQDLFNSYSNKIAQIHLYQRAMQKIATNELKQLNKDAKAFEQYSDFGDLSASYDNMFFTGAKRGEPIFYGHFERSIEERKLAVVLHKNKQYQWLLAEAYEEFEDFLENAYALAGFKDNNFWPLRDYGNISLKELQKKPLTWFVSQAKKKKDIPSSIINKFRETYPEISKVEKENSLNVNLRLSITLIEYLRHIIVHKAGRVTDKNEFVKVVLQKLGLYNNGNADDKNIEYIKAFFGTDEYENTISLLEFRVNPEIPLDVHINVFDMLSGHLMAYAHLISESLSNSNTMK